MDNESQDVQNQEVQNVEGQEAAVQTTPSFEDLAREKGWRPKEEYNGEPSKWKSAEVFLALEEPIQKIEALAKELKEQKKASALLLQHHQQVKQSEFKRAYEFLKAQKKEAFEKGDVDKILEIDDQLEMVRETQKQQQQVEFQPQATQQTNEIHPDFKSWVDNNKWYETDSTMREMADAIGLTHAQKNTNKSPVEVLTFVTQQIKKMYPDKFTNPNRQTGSGVESPARSSVKQDIGFELSDEEKSAMNTFVRQGIMSKEEYIKELKQIKGIK